MCLKPSEDVVASSTSQSNQGDHSPSGAPRNLPFGAVVAVGAYRDRLGRGTLLGGGPAGDATLCPYASCGSLRSGVVSPMGQPLF